MTSFIDKIKAKTHHKSPTNDHQTSEPQYSIQPHPAKTNDPADLQRDDMKNQPGGGLQTSNTMAPFQARGPYIPSADIKNNLETPVGRDQLQARQAELNNPDRS